MPVKKNPDPAGKKNRIQNLRSSYKQIKCTQLVPNLLLLFRMQQLYDLIIARRFDQPLNFLLVHEIDEVQDVHYIVCSFIQNADWK